MGDKTLGITTEMNVDDITDGLTEIADQLVDLPQSQDIDINLTGDALDQVNSLIDSLTRLNDEESNPEANLEGNAQESVETLQSDLTSIDNEIINPEANLEGDAQEDVETLKSDMTDLDSETANPEANLGGDALENVETLKEDMTELDGEVATPEADLQGDALEKADELREDLEDLNDTTVTPEVDSDSIDESASSSSNAAAAITGITSAIAAVDVEAKRMGTERSLEKALYYEGVPVTTSNVNALRSSLAQLAPYMPTEESSEGFYILAKGLKNADDVAAELPAAFKLIKTGAIDTDTAMYDLSSIIATYGLHGQDAADVTSYLNEAFLNLKVSTPTEALNALTGSLRTLKSVGFNAEEITNYISAFDQVGVSASSAVSALTIGAKSLQKQLTSTSYEKSNAKVALDAMHIDAKNADGSFRSVADIMDEVTQKTSTMTDAQFQAAYGISKNEALIDLFGSRGALTFGLLKESAQDAGQATTDSANKTTDAMSQTNAQTITLGSEVQKLWNKIINFPLPDWDYELIGKISLIVGGLAVAIPIVKKVGGGLLEIKDAVQGLISKIQELKGTGDIKNPLEEWDEKVFGDKTVKETVQTKFEIVSDEAGELKAEGDVNSFVEKTKTKLGELKESNVWKMLFGDEKGSLNFSILDQAEARIGSFVDNTKSKLAELKGAISTGLDEGYEHYYGGSESASESSENLDKVTGKVKESINKVDGFLDEGYEYYYGTSNNVENTSSETLDKITEDVEGAKDKIGEILDKGYEHYYGKTGSFLDDEEGAIRGFNLDDLVNKVSSAKNRISEILDEGYEHYYGNNDKTVESSSETLDKITEKVESTKDKIGEILDEGYDHYYGKTGSFLDDEEGRIRGFNLDELVNKVEDTKNKITKILDEGYEHYYGNNSKTIESNSETLDKITSKFEDTKDKIGKILDEGYEHYYGNNGKAVESNSEILDKITGKFESTKDKIGEILDEGYDHYYGKTGSFLDDEEGRIQGVSWDDLVSKVSSAKDKITGVLDDGYEHYYGDNNKAVDSNSETLDKITEKFESTKNKVNEILDEGYEHYYGDNNKIESSSSETLTKLTSKVESTKEKITGILDDGYEHYYGDTKSFLDDEEGRVNTSLSDLSSRISSFISDTKAKLGELKDSDVWSKIFGDEKGTVTAAEGKVSGFVDDAKAKINELNGYDVYDRIFKDTGEGDTAYSKISGIIDNLKLKVGDLDGSNVYTRIFGSGTTTGTTPTVGSGTEEPKTIEMTKNSEGTYEPDWSGTGGSSSTGSGESIFDKIKGGIKGTLGKLPGGGEIVDTLLNGLYTSAKVGSGKAVGYSLGTTLFDMLNMGAADAGVFLGMDLPGNPLWNLENNQPLIDWDPINQMKKDIGNAGNKNVPGSLADQLNLPGWLKGQGIDLGSASLGGLGNLGSLVSNGSMSMGAVLGFNTPSAPDWDPINHLKTDLGNAGNKNIPGSLADQLNLPGWLKGHGVSLESSYKMPKISWSGLTSGLDGAKTTVQTKLGQLQQYVSSNVTSKLPKVNWSTIHQGLDGAKSTVQGKWGQLKQYVSSHAPNTKLNWTTIHQGLDTAKNTVQTKWGGLQQYVTQHTPKVKVPTWADVEKGLDPAKQWVQNEWNALKTYVESHVPKVPIPKWSDIEKGEHEAVQWVQNEWNKFMQWLGTLPGKMENYGGQIVHGLEEGILNGIPGLRSALSVIQGMTETHSPPKTGPLSNVSAGNWANWGNQLINGLSSGLSSGFGGLDVNLESITSKTSSFLASMQSTSSHLWSTGLSMINNLSGGITAGLPNLSSVFTRISNMFPHSPPKEGPLATIKAENMKSWAASLAQGGVAGLSRFTGYMDEMVQLPRLSNLSNPGLTKAINSSQVGQTVIYLTVQDGAVQVNGNADKNVVNQGGNLLGNSISSSLQKGAVTNGLKPTVILRR